MHISGWQVASSEGLVVDMGAKVTCLGDWLGDPVESWQSEGWQEAAVALAASTETSNRLDTL